MVKKEGVSQKIFKNLKDYQWGIAKFTSFIFLEITIFCFCQVGIFFNRFFRSGVKAISLEQKYSKNNFKRMFLSVTPFIIPTKIAYFL